jgi:hypothetical protein
MGSVEATAGDGATPKKQLILNAFDMFTVGHLSPGQWKVRSQAVVFVPFGCDESTLQQLRRC